MEGRIASRISDIDYLIAKPYYNLCTNLLIQNDSFLLGYVLLLIFIGSFLLVVASI